MKLIILVGVLVLAAAVWLIFGRHTQCHNCGFYYPARAPQCPNCGCKPRKDEGPPQVRRRSDTK